MKRFNEMVANELLHVLKDTYNFDWVKDNVNIKFYAQYDQENYFIGQYYSLDMIGDYLLEQFKVKKFGFTIEDSKRFDSTFVEIFIVLNM